MIFDAALAHTGTLIKYEAHTRAISAPPTIILGLSGGPDSVFLFHILRTLHEQQTINLIAAHLDHEWRASSAQDALFCEKLCKYYDINLVVAKGSGLTIKKKYNGSHEELGRSMRRTLFAQVQQQYNADFIALAHHLDDQEETFFIRLMRGTSLQGLHGMDTVDGPYIRPLLTYKKQDLVSYLNEHTLDYVIDPSNDSEDFLRNRIRKFILPALRKCDVRFDKNFARSLNMLKAEDAFLTQLTHQTFKTIFTHDDATNTLMGNLTLFNQLHPVLQHRVVLMWLIATHIPCNISHHLITEIARFLNHNRGGVHQLTSSFAITKKQKSFWVEHVTSN